LQLKKAQVEKEKAVQELAGKTVGSEEAVDVFKNV